MVSIKLHLFFKQTNTFSTYCQFMLKGYKILTITHKNASLKEISHYVVKDGTHDVQQQLLELKKQFQIDELMYLSTCNRAMYLLYTKQDVDTSFTADFFNCINPALELEAQNLPSTISQYENEQAIQHLFEVAASTDSMVIGEREILRQIREAYQQSLDWKLTGDNIRLAIKLTVEAAKEAYANTRIGEKPVSVVSLAIQQLLKTNLPKDARILMIGAGQTNSLVAKFLKKHQFTNVNIFNRSIGRAQQLANLLEGEAYTLDALQNYQKGFDGLIVCTGATSAIITPDLYQKLLGGDTDKKVVVDLSLPNNVALEVVAANSMHYIEIEGLRTLADENKAFREREVARVKELLHIRLETFKELYQERLIERAMKEVPIQIKAVKSKAMNEIFKKEVELLDDDTRQLVDRMLSYMEKQCIGIPMKAAKQSFK